jgi:hypothetical protein
MNDPERVCAFERLRDLPGNRHRLVERERTLGDSIGERGSIHQFKDKCLHTIGFFEAVNRAMLEWFREASTCASRLKRASRSGQGEKLRKNLQSDASRFNLVSRAR